MLIRRTSARSLLVLGAVATLGLAAPAQAHDVLEGSEPAAGSTVATAPDEMVLTYSDTIQQVGGKVSVTGPDGAVVAEGEPTVAGTVASLDLPDDLAPGQYTATWRVVSSDGHPISGTTAFTLAGDQSPAASGTASSESATSSPAESPATSDESSGSTSGEATPSAESSPAASEGEQETGDASAPEDGQDGRLGYWIGLGALALALAGAAAFMLRRH